MMKIRTLLIFSLVASAIFSCQKSEMEGDHNQGYSNGEIEYSMYANRPTKAEVLDNSNFAAFEIDSYKHEEDPDNKGTLLPVASYYKETVAKDATSGVWAGKMPRRWLVAPGVLDFYAYSDKVNVSGYIGATAGVAPTFKYTVGAADAQQDLLVGSAIGRTESSNQGKLSLDFKHALTQIGLKAKSVSPAIKVMLKSVKFVGVNSVGKFSYDGTATVGAWSDQETAADYTFTVETPAAVDNLTAVEQISADGNMMFIPSADPKDVEIQVTYDVYDAADGTTVIASDVNKTIKIKAEADAAGVAAAAVTPWNMGKKVTYTLILTAPANEIIFGETTLENWADETEIEYDGKDIFSMSKMFLSPINTGSIKVLVGDNRPTPGGFTIKSGGNWVKFSKAANDASPTATLTHTPTASKAGAVAGTEIYVYVAPNATGVKRTAKIALEREGYDSYELEVEQEGFNEPFKNVAAFAQAGAYAQVYKVEKMMLKNGIGLSYKLSAPAGFKVSLDGVGEGKDNIVATGNDGATPVDFYVHTASDRVLTAKSGNVTLEFTNPNGNKTTYSYAISQRANVEIYIGRFTGATITKKVGNETHYYFEKGLFAAAANEAGSLVWGSGTAVATQAIDKLDGRANTLKLNTLSTTAYPAANACYKKSSATTPAKEFFLGAQNQMMGVLIANAAIAQTVGTLLTSTENESDNTMYWSTRADHGHVNAPYLKGATLSIVVRCIREAAL